MGYFEGLAGACFKKDECDRTVFFPLGVLAKGRVLPDASAEAHVRKFLVRYYKITLPITILLSAFHKWVLVAAVVIASIIWFYVFCKKTTSHLPISNTKLTLKEGYTGSAHAHNKPTLWFLFLLSILFVVGGVFMVVVANTLEKRLIGLTCLVFFGLCGAAIGFMLRTKYRTA